MFFHMVYKSGQIFLPFCQNSRVWRTNGQTDRRTDGQTEFSSLYRVCIACSEVLFIAPRQIAKSSNSRIIACRVAVEVDNQLAYFAFPAWFDGMQARNIYWCILFIHSSTTEEPGGHIYCLKYRKYPNTYITENYKYKKGNTKQTKNTK